MIPVDTEHVDGVVVPGLLDNTKAFTKPEKIVILETATPATMLFLIKDRRVERWGWDDSVMAVVKVFYAVRHSHS